MANEPRKPFQSPAPLPLPTPPGSSKDKEKDKGGAALPLWSSASSSSDKLAGMPLFRGAAQKSGGVVGRLKSLKTKDVAFIGAGLAVLVMAPLAEYLISEGEDKAGQLQGGFASNSSPFNEGRDPSEIGIMGLARGGVPGDNSDVITPLNARDPSSLIMGGNGEQKEAPAAAAVEPKRDAPKDSVWDKVVSSAKSGASAATRKVSLPKPGGKLAGAINGLRSLSGGSTGASLKLAAPDSKGLFSAPKNESHLAATQPVPGYRGAGARSPAGGSGGNSSGRFGGGLSGGGGSAGDVMNGAGGISGGGRGSGFSGGDGEPTKNPGGSSTKDSKTLGESLAFLRQKMEMEKAIDLKWAKKRYDELERKKMIEQTLVQTAQQAFMKVLDKLLEGKKDGAGGGSGGGGSPGGGGGEKPPGGPAVPPGNPAGLPSGGVARSPRPKPEQSEIAVPANRGFGQHNDILGDSASDLRAEQAKLAKFVQGVTPTDDYGKQILPPAQAAVDKGGKAADGIEKAKASLGEATTSIGTANEKIGQANEKIEGKLGKYDAFNKELAGFNEGLGKAGAEPKADVEPSKLQGPGSQVQAITKEDLSGVGTNLEDAQKKVQQGGEAAKAAPRDFSGELAKIQAVVSANPNCAGCKAALTAVQTLQKKAQEGGQAADGAVSAGNLAVGRSNAAKTKTEMLDGFLERGKSLVTTAQTGAGTDYTEMQAAKEKYDAGVKLAKSDAAKGEEMKKEAIADADKVRTAAAQRAEKVSTFAQQKRKNLEEAKKQLGK